MSRTWTTDELRQVYAELKRQGLSRYDYDELVRIDSQGRLMMTTDVVDASKAACQAIRDTFKQLASFQIVAMNRKINGDNWMPMANKKYSGPYEWALYLEIDDTIDHPDIFLDGYDAVSQHIPEIDDILAVAKSHGVDINKNNVHADIRGRQSSTMQECDGGAAAGGGAGGDAGGATGGDAGGVAAVDAGDTAGEIAGTSTSDVLGTYEPGKGVMGHNNFFIPARVKHPLHRWEAAYGGSKRKKTKKGKDKKYAYEKGMKVVVDMLEDEQTGKWIYHEEMPNADNDFEEYDFKEQVTIPDLQARLKTTIDDAQFFDTGFDDDYDGFGEEDSYEGFKMEFPTKQAAVQYALDRLDDELVQWENDSREYASEEDWEEDKPRAMAEHEKAKKDILSKNYASFTDGRHTVWSCEIYKA